MRRPSSTRSAKRGVSLVELLVSSSLMMILLGAVYVAVTSGIAYQRRSEALLDLEQTSLTTLAFVNRELTETNYEAIHIPLIQNWEFTFPLARDTEGAANVDGQGRPLWDTVVCYRLEDFGGEKRLVRQAEQVGGDHLLPLDPSTLVPARTPAYFASSSQPVRVLANHLKSFNVTKLLTGTGMLQIRMEFEVKTNLHAYGLKVENKVRPRN